MTAQITSAQADLPGRRMAVSLSALAGIGYAAAWIISLSVGAPNPSVAASGSQVVAAFAGRDGSGHFPAGPTLTHPASLAGAPGSPAGRSPDDARTAPRIRRRSGIRGRSADRDHPSVLRDSSISAT
jgi:hypothetical protein